MAIAQARKDPSISPANVRPKSERAGQIGTNTATAAK